jgi:hypothetical protein
LSVTACGLVGGLAGERFDVIADLDRHLVGVL